MSALDSGKNQRPADGRVDRGERCRPQRVLVVDDHELTQAGLRAVLAREDWVDSCLGAASVEAAWSIARRHHPQIVLLSTSVQGRPGLELCRAFREHMPYVKVMLMSNDGTVPASLARAHGAVGILPKQSPISGIVASVRRVAEGGRVFPKGAVAPDSVQLSRRELDVLRYLVSGLSNPEVAARLNLSRHTVKQHTSVVYRKLGVRNRAEAASRAQVLGLVA
ncbi:response regulator transcription factor [Nocardioides antri]|uniref:response regulator transcription factor n=1 Tax=Nocardioides antri TaxID=2607659 RepID=UPI00165F5735|nr:response regulator transcription factor [Nocardioides antri]